jgi:hypothetical protein
MDETTSTGPAADETGGASQEVIAASEISRLTAPEATFKGNTYDLAALGALASGVVVLFSCLTCNMGFYCLPLLPLVLGLIGLLGARQSVEGERTRLWSWLGIAAGGFIVLLTIAGVVLYIAFIVLAVAAGQGNR